MAEPLPCGHAQQTIEGVSLPCADWHCAGSPPGDSYVVPTNDDGRHGRRLLFERQLNDGVVTWRLEQATPIDWEAIDEENRQRTMRHVFDGFAASDKLAALDPVAVARSVLRAYFDDPHGFEDMDKAGRKRAVEAVREALPK